VTVAHNYNLSYLSGWHWEDAEGSSRLAWQKVCKTPSQPIAGYCSAHLSSKLHMRLKSGWLRFQAQQGRYKVHKTPFEQKRLGMVMCACHSNYCRKFKIRRSQSSMAKAKIWKITTAKRTEGMTEAVQCLSSKSEVLTSNSNSGRKKQKEWKKKEKKNQRHLLKK
jgi:hypothetical protein